MVQERATTHYEALGLPGSNAATEEAYTANPVPQGQEDVGQGETNAGQGGRGQSHGVPAPSEGVAWTQDGAGRDLYARSGIAGLLKQSKGKSLAKQTEQHHKYENGK